MLKRRFQGKFGHGQCHTFPSEDSSANFTGQFSKADQITSFSANQNIQFLSKNKFKVFFKWPWHSFAFDPVHLKILSLSELWLQKCCGQYKLPFSMCMCSQVHPGRKTYVSTKLPVMTKEKTHRGQVKCIQRKEKTPRKRVGNTPCDWSQSGNGYSWGLTLRPGI